MTDKIDIIETEKKFQILNKKFQDTLLYLDKLTVFEENQIPKERIQQFIDLLEDKAKFDVQMSNIYNAIEQIQKLKNKKVLKIFIRLDSKMNKMQKENQLLKSRVVNSSMGISQEKIEKMKQKFIKMKKIIQHKENVILTLQQDKKARKKNKYIDNIITLQNFSKMYQTEQKLVKKINQLQKKQDEISQICLEEQNSDAKIEKIKNLTIDVLKFSQFQSQESLGNCSERIKKLDQSQVILMNEQLQNKFDKLKSYQQNLKQLKEEQDKCQNQKNQFKIQELDQIIENIQLEIIEIFYNNEEKQKNIFFYYKSKGLNQQQKFKEIKKMNVKILNKFGIELPSDNKFFQLAKNYQRLRSINYFITKRYFQKEQSQKNIFKFNKNVFKRKPKSKINSLNNSVNNQQKVTNYNVTQNKNQMELCIIHQRNLLKKAKANQTSIQEKIQQVKKGLQSFQKNQQNNDVANQMERIEEQVDFLSNILEEYHGIHQQFEIQQSKFLKSMDEISSTNKSDTRDFMTRQSNSKRNSVDTNILLSKRNSYEQNVDSVNISINKNYFQKQFQTSDSNQYQNNKDVSSLSQTLLLESASSLKGVTFKANKKIKNILKKYESLKNFFFIKFESIKQQCSTVQEKMQVMFKNHVQLKRICDAVRFNFQISEQCENYDDFYEIFKRKFKQLKSEVSESKKTLFQNQLHQNKQHIYQLEDDNKSLNYFKNQIVNFFSFNNQIVSAQDPDEIMFEKIHHFLYQNSKMQKDLNNQENLIENYKNLLRKEKQDLQDKKQIIQNLDDALIAQKKKFNQQKKVLQDELKEIKSKLENNKNTQSFQESQKLFNQYQKNLQERDKKIASLQMEIARFKLLEQNQPEKDINSLSHMPSKESTYSEEESFKMMEYNQKRKYSKGDGEKIPTKETSLTKEQQTQKKIQQKFKHPLDLEGIAEEYEEDDSFEKNFLSEFDTLQDDQDDMPEFMFKQKIYEGDVLVSSEKDISEYYQGHDFNPNFDNQY